MCSIYNTHFCLHPSQVPLCFSTYTGSDTPDAKSETKATSGEERSGWAAEREVDLGNVPGWTIHFGERQIASCSILKLYGLSKTQLDLFWPKAKRIRSENLLHKGGLLGSLCPQDVYNFCAMSRRWGHRSAWHETEKSGMTWFSKEQENSCSLFWITKSGVAGLDLEMQRPQVRVSEGRLVWTKVSLMLKITFDTFGGMH